MSELPESFDILKFKTLRGIIKLLALRTFTARVCYQLRRKCCKGFSRYAVSRVHLDIRAKKARGKKTKKKEEKGAARNRREEDEASEIRLETSNLRESPASCNYHVCQPDCAPSPGLPFSYPCVPHSRPPLSPPRRRRRRFHLSFHPAPSSHQCERSPPPPLLVPPLCLTLPFDRPPV